MQDKRNTNYSRPENDSGNKKPDKIPINILTKGIKDVEDIKLIKEWGEYLATKDNEKVKSTQLRKFFGAVKRIQADFDSNKHEIILLNVKLAYAVGKSNEGNKLKDFFEVIEPLINDVNEDKNKFKNFVNVFEAIVAYHRAKGGD